VSLSILFDSMISCTWKYHYLATKAKYHALWSFVWLLLPASI